MVKKKRSKPTNVRSPPPPSLEGVGVAPQDPAFGSAERLKLPHERDESPTDLAKRGERGARQRELMEQAKDDLDHGLVDTDCRAPHGSESPCPPMPRVGPKKKTRKPRR
jgi:hypothetical protein